MRLSDDRVTSRSVGLVGIDIFSTLKIIRFVIRIRSGAVDINVNTSRPGPWILFSTISVLSSGNLNFKKNKRNKEY